MYAIIETGGKQYRVTPGDVVSLEKLDGNVGQTITFDKVLLIGGKADNNVIVGTPYVAQAALAAEIVEQAKGEKILTIKYRRRKGYRRTMGHRQLLTRVLVTKIEDGQGQTLAFDAAKRADILRKASVPFSTRQKDHQAKHEAAKAASAPSASSAKKTKSAQPASAPTTVQKNSAPRKTTTKKKA